MKNLPRLSDAAERAQQLGQLGQAGLGALDQLDGKAPPAGSKNSQVEVLTESAKPVALTRFTFLPSLQKLLDAGGAK